MGIEVKKGEVTCPTGQRQTWGSQQVAWPQGLTPGPHMVPPSIDSWGRIRLKLKVSLGAWLICVHQELLRATWKDNECDSFRVHAAHRAGSWLMQVKQVSGFCVQCSSLFCWEACSPKRVPSGPAPLLISPVMLWESLTPEETGNGVLLSEDLCPQPHRVHSSQQHTSGSLGCFDSNLEQDQAFICGLTCTDGMQYIKVVSFPINSALVLPPWAVVDLMLCWAVCGAIQAHVMIQMTASCGKEAWMKALWC